tara:strand:+ start:683 stop:1402 length:720 start_codon:yes stop_codon:yes gene_type:complete
MTVLHTLKNNILNFNKIENISEHLRFMQSLGDSGVFEATISEILATPKLLADVASRSYGHVNLFSKIVLIDNSNPESYRLTAHFWHPRFFEQNDFKELIHNHRFNFWSYIHKGKMISQNFHEHDQLEDQDTLELNRFRYMPSKTGNIHDCSYEKKVCVKLAERLVFNKGETYYMHYKTIHRVIYNSKSPPLCTFVLRGPRQRSYTNTYNTFYPERSVSSAVPMMQSDELRKTLETIAAL